MIEGYNVGIKLDSKMLLCRTQESLSISANVKESITKDDAGNKTRLVSGHDVTLKVTALMALNTGTGTATKLDRDDVIELALKKGSAAELPLVYEASGCDTYEGTAIITNYSEDTSADGDSTISLDLAITGSFAKQTT